MSKEIDHIYLRVFLKGFVIMKDIKKITLSGVLLAATLILPFLTGQIPQIGSMLSPMHIPVLICGFVCGWQYGAIVGAVAPILRFLCFGMPPLFPVGLAMTFELAAYGACAGLVYKALPRKTINVYVSLIVSMIIGRLVWGVAMFGIAAVSSVNFSIEAFIAGAFINSVPGIIAHIIIIPVIVIALKKGNYFSDELCTGKAY